MVNPGPIALKAVSDALANIGVREDGPPYTNHGKSVGIYLASCGLDQGYAWCAAFCNYRLHTAGHELGLNLPDNFPNHGDAAAAAHWASWAKDKGVWMPHTVTPKRGDLCCFDITSEGGIHHIGFVVSADDSTVVTVEGNTRPDGSAIRDGYCVASRHRHYGDFGPHGGFIRIGY